MCGELSPTDIAVYAAMALFADADGGRLWPSNRTLADSIRVSKDTVERSISRLVCCGFVTKSSRFRADNGRTSNEYRLTLHPSRKDAADPSGVCAATPSSIDAATTCRTGAEPPSRSDAAPKNKTRMNKTIGTRISAPEGACESQANHLLSMLPPEHQAHEPLREWIGKYFAMRKAKRYGLLADDTVRERAKDYSEYTPAEITDAFKVGALGEHRGVFPKKAKAVREFPRRETPTEKADRFLRERGARRVNDAA